MTDEEKTETCPFCGEEFSDDRCLSAALAKIAEMKIENEDLVEGVAMAVDTRFVLFIGWCSEKKNMPPDVCRTLLNMWSAFETPAKLAEEIAAHEKL